MGLKEDIKLQQERLSLENDIANRVERQTKSLSAYREGAKEVKENASATNVELENIRKSLRNLKIKTANFSAGNQKSK